MTPSSIFKDPSGKPSAMRAASLVVVLVGCVMLLAATFGKGNLEVTDDALWLIALGIGGKWVQHMAEANGS